MKLLLNALTKFTAGLLLVALVLFLPAGTIRYPGGLLFLCLLFVPMLLMVIRIRGEEKLLTAELSGYEEYKRKVRYRMIPFIW